VITYQDRSVPLWTTAQAQPTLLISLALEHLMPEHDDPQYAVVVWTSQHCHRRIPLQHDQHHVQAPVQEVGDLQRLQHAYRTVALASS
jgi:hypothetical protein